MAGGFCEIDSFPSETVVVLYACQREPTQPRMGLGLLADDLCGNVSPESLASSNLGTPRSTLHASILCMVFLLLGMTFLL